MPLEKTLPVIQEACLAMHPDIVFLQIDPMNYIIWQRYQAHKSALHEIEDYDMRGVEDLQFPRPHSWEECVVNLITIDTLRANNTFLNIDYTKGLSTFSYPYITDEKTVDNLTPWFVQSITDYIVCDNWSPYFDINQALFTTLMGKHKVLLGDMPEILLWQILGNSLSLEDAKDVFKFVLDQISKAKFPVQMQTATI
jgi:hypothetical protein